MHAGPPSYSPRMAMVIAGIDEAGYGPTLGPLVVSMTVFKIDRPIDEGVPNLWTLLGSGVCRDPGRNGSAGPGGRVPIADSKRLKLANSVRSTHPLVHLERGVLAFKSHAAGSAPMDLATHTDVSLAESVGAFLPGSAWYQGEPIPLPVALTAGEAGISSNLVGQALERASVSLLSMRGEIVSESSFNTTIDDTGNKSETTILAVGRHIRWLLESPLSELGMGDDDRLGVVCDRLGGRAMYAEVLERLLPGFAASVVEEGPERSRYVVEGKGRRVGVSFLTEAEGAHLPVALASMLAKYLRELTMLRFNRYWSARAADHGLVELKPTAGYALDARRWLTDAAPMLDASLRRDLVRKA